jgi:hypothetical protein
MNRCGPLHFFRALSDVKSSDLARNLKRRARLTVPCIRSRGLRSSMTQPGTWKVRRISFSLRRSAPPMLSPTEKHPGAPNTAISEALPNLTLKELKDAPDRSRPTVSGCDTCFLGVVMATRSLSMDSPPRKTRVCRRRSKVNRGVALSGSPSSFLHINKRGQPIAWFVSVKGVNP